MISTRIQLFVALALMGCPTVAAATVKVCFDVEVAYTDAGSGESYWIETTPTGRSARGTLAQVKRDGVIVHSGFLGDGLGTGDLGCTAALAGSSVGTWTYSLVTLGHVNGNYVTAVNDDTDDSQESIAGSHVEASSVSTLDITCAPNIGEEQVWSVFMAAAFSIYRHNGGLAGEMYKFNVGSTGSTGSGACNDCWKGGELWIQDSFSAYRKFIVSHLVAHLLINAATSNKFVNAANCTLSDVDACANAPVGSHSPNSVEYAGCAFSEGMCNFYAADVWNNGHNDAGTCAWRSGLNSVPTALHGIGGSPNTISQPVIDCDDGTGTSSTYPTAYMEYVNTNAPACGGDLEGKGTELDWQRALWNWHNDSGGPSFTQIMQIADAADAWDKESAWDCMNDAVAAYNGGAFAAEWTAATQAHGVDHSTTCP